MSLAAALSNQDLALRCAAETERFTRHQGSDPQFCFELFRRGLAAASEEAFTLVYRVFETRVLNWVYSHSRFLQTDESAEFFARTAMSNFYFALRGPRFEQFATLAQVLSYLKLCVHTAITQYIRDTRPGAVEPLGERDASTEADLAAGAEIAELWEYIRSRLPDERSRLLAFLAFVQDLAPRQIVAAYPHIWDTERQATIELYRIRRMLREDSELARRMYEA